MVATFAPIFPDYQGKSLVNLMACVENFLGGNSQFSPLTYWKPEEFEDVNTLILLVVDGMGYEYLTKTHGNSRLARHVNGKMTSVFPSTTASAITTFYTGLSPHNHGVLSWHVFLKELGVAGKILPFIARYSSGTLAKGEIKPAEVFQASPLFNRVEAPCYVILPEKLPGSPYNRTITAGSRAIGYKDVDRMVSTVMDLCKGTSQFGTGYKRFITAYWPDLDDACHEHGVGSQTTRDTFQVLENSIEPLLDFVENDPRVRLIITADHGLVDTTQETRLELSDHPKLQETLTLPLCGEGRSVFCYVRPSRVIMFEKYVEDALEQYCTLRKGPELIEERIFGVGDAHPKLFDRVGDYILLMKDNFILRDRLLGEDRHEMVGFHGGVSAAEMYVPFILF